MPKGVVEFFQVKWFRDVAVKTKLRRNGIDVVVAAQGHQGQVWILVFDLRENFEALLAIQAVV